MVDRPMALLPRPFPNHRPRLLRKNDLGHEADSAVKRSHCDTANSQNDPSYDPLPAGEGIGQEGEEIIEGHGALRRLRSFSGLSKGGAIDGLAQPERSSLSE
jgi:hypothetical protein